MPAKPGGYRRPAGQNGAFPNEVLFQRTPADWIDVDFSGWGHGPQEREKFLRIKQAVLESRVLSFTYYSTCGQTTNRRIEPMKLRFRGSAWYVHGFCLEKQELRVFKVSRMEGISVTEEAFDRRALELPPLEEESLPAERMVSLTLEFEHGALTGYTMSLTEN